MKLVSKALDEREGDPEFTERLSQCQHVTPLMFVKPMPRYFFTVSLEDNLLPDSEGQELPDPDAAWEAARRMAGDLMRVELDSLVRWQDCFFDVKDAAGETVLEFPFLEAAEPQGELPN